MDFKKKILIFLLPCLLITSICFSQTRYPVSSNTIKSIIQLKGYIDIYLQDAFKDLTLFGSDQKENVKQILNYGVIISGKLNSLISILVPSNYNSEQEQTENLSPKEVSKFIDYIIERVEIMETELDRDSQSANQALIIHHIEKIKEFIQETKRALSLVQSELASS